MKTQKTAIILGATGLTGNYLLKQLLVDDDYHKIKVFTWRPLNINNPKIEEIKCNVLELEKQKEYFIGDEVFCCIGTTKKKTPNKKEYKSIDYGIPLAAAKLCKINNISKILIISSLGAKESSIFFYNKTKGEMEKDVLEQNISETYFFRPSIIVGKRSEKRSGEDLGIFLFNFIKPLLIGKLKRYRAIKAENITKAMHYVAKNKYKENVIFSEEIEELVQNKNL